MVFRISPQTVRQISLQIFVAGTCMGSSHYVNNVSTAAPVSCCQHLLLAWVACVWASPRWRFLQHLARCACCWFGCLCAGITRLLWFGLHVWASRACCCVWLHLCGHHAPAAGLGCMCGHHQGKRLLLVWAACVWA